MALTERFQGFTIASALATRATSALTFSSRGAASTSAWLSRDWDFSPKR